MSAPEQSPLVSVLVPVYNVEAYVEDCLRSLLAQDVDGLEVIVINDGSTDGSREIVGRVAQEDERIHIIDKPNSGYGASLNRGLDEAQGTYVGILESDDEMVPGALAALLAIAQDRGADVVKGDYILWWPTDEKRTHQAHEVIPGLCEGLVDTRTDMRVYSIRSTIWSGLYRRDHLLRHGIRFQETPGASYQDTSFNFKVFATSDKTAFMTDPVIRYRQDNASSSIHSSGKAEAVGVEFDEIDRWLDAHPDAVGHDQLVRESLIQRFNAYRWNLDRLDESLVADYLHSIGVQFAAFEASGRFDPATWDSWRMMNLRVMQVQPKRYMRLRKLYRGTSTLSKIGFALGLGGIRGLVAALDERRSRRVG